MALILKDPMKAKKLLLSVKAPKNATMWTSLLLRGIVGILFIPHGWTKLVHFTERSDTFHSFLGLGSTLSLSLCIFAEVVCAFFLLIGLFTRLSAIVLIINTLVILYVNQWNIFANNNADHAAILLIGVVCVLIAGPGKISLDEILAK